jgi:imidazoleglycerol phosphate synthase glutamine amidotransferase subunit HisH
MGIRTKNLQSYILELRIARTLSATTDADSVMVPFAGYISNAVAKLATQGTAANPIIDVNKNGTTIFGAATKVTGNTVSSTFGYSDLSSDHLNLAAGDIISIDVDTAGTAAANFMLNLTLTKTPVKQPSHVADHNETL